MTTPTILPVGFAGNSTDFLKTKCSRDGDAFVNVGIASVPSGTTTTTIVGLVPFNAGARLITGATDAAADALGTSVTVNLGVVYDDNVGNTNNQTLFASGLTGAAAGGALPLAETTTNIPYITTGNGWVVATIGGATTGNTGNIAIQATLDYFTGGIQ